MLKILIIIVMVAMVASLFSGLVFLFKDSGVPGSRRVLRALGVRISLAVTLLLLVSYGFYTGQLGVHAPWHNPQAQAPSPQTAGSPSTAVHPTSHP